MYRVGGKGLSFRLRERYRWLLVVSWCQVGFIVVECGSPIKAMALCDGNDDRDGMYIPLIPNDVVPPATAAKACSI
jgi:hypothetical protein